MADPVFFYCFHDDLSAGKHVVGTSAYKVCLTNTQPNLADASYTDLSEIASGNGYTTGGDSTTVTKTTSLGTTRWFGTDVTFAATGAMATFRYAVVYNNTHASKPLVCYYDYGQAISLGATDGFVVDFNATLGFVKLEYGAAE